MNFKFVGLNTRLRLTYDRDIWFPFQSIKIPNKLSNRKLNPSQLHIDVSEKFEEVKFKFGETFKKKKDEVVFFKSYKFRFVDFYHLKNLTASLNDSFLDLDKCKFKLPFTREYIFRIHFDSKKNNIYIKSGQINPCVITALILPEDFEQLEFEYV